MDLPVFLTPQPMISQPSKASAPPGASQHLASWLPRLYHSSSAHMPRKVDYHESAALVRGGFEGRVDFF